MDPVSWAPPEVLAVKDKTTVSVTVIVVLPAASLRLKE